MAIKFLEDHPHKSHLSRTSPFYSAIVCLAENNPSFDKTMAKLVEASLYSDAALLGLQEILAHDPKDGQMYKVMMSTTQAVDLIEGGVKVNALPERASAVVNHRISIDRFEIPKLLYPQVPDPMTTLPQLYSRPNRSSQLYFYPFQQSSQP